MITGIHYVRDVFCKQCDTKIGWMYELAITESERYKEGAVTLEKKLIKKVENPFVEGSQRSRHRVATPEENERSPYTGFPHNLLDRPPGEEPFRHFGYFEPVTTNDRLRIRRRGVEPNPRDSEALFGETSDLFMPFRTHRRLDSANMPNDFHGEMQAAMNEILPRYNLPSMNEPQYNAPEPIFDESDLDPTTGWADRIQRRLFDHDEFIPNDDNRARRRREIRRRVEEEANEFRVQEERRIMRELEEMHEQLTRDLPTSSVDVHADADDDGTTEDGDW